MAENKDQHYVPKMLMKRFADEKHIFSFIFNDSKDLKTVINVPYDNQCQYGYYYGRDKEWEHLLNGIETKASPIFDKICMNHSYYPSVDEIKIIKNFFLAQRTRTPRMVNWEKANIRQSYLEGFRMYLYHGEPIRLSQSEIEMVDSSKTEYFEEQAKHMMRSICFNSSYISDLELIIVHFNCKTNLILSDDPVIVLNPFMHSAGLINIGIVILMPISPQTVIVLRDPVLFEPVKKIIYSIREKAVNSLNIFQSITFDKRIMFCDSHDVEYVRELIQKTSTERKTFNKIGEGAIFYGKKDSMLITHNPSLLPNYPYIFSSIKREYRRFKFIDIINYRFKNNKYLDRLDTLLPIVGRNPLSKTSVEKIPKYKEFTISYWQEHKKFETEVVNLEK